MKKKKIFLLGLMGILSVCCNVEAGWVYEYDYAEDGFIKKTSTYNKSDGQLYQINYDYYDANGNRYMQDMNVYPTGSVVTSRHVSHYENGTITKKDIYEYSIQGELQRTGEGIYDKNGDVVIQKYKYPSGTGLQYTYDRDTNGNVERYSMAWYNEKGQKYKDTVSTYDASTLTSKSPYFPPKLSEVVYTYSYDGQGKLTYSYADGKLFEKYFYDSNGNMLGKDIYDSDGQLLNTYKYASDGTYEEYDNEGKKLGKYNADGSVFIPKRIYTVEEATQATKGNKNTFSIRYR